MPGMRPINAMAVEAFAPTMPTFRRGRDDLAPKFNPVLSSLQRFFEVLPVFGPARAGIFGV
jgi:hypothetical protein